MTTNGWHDLPNEKAFRSAVVELARAQGWTVYFAPDQPTNRRGGPGRAGFPDLMMYKDDRVLAFELKMGNADVTEEQFGWLKALRHHIPAYEVRFPKDVPIVKWILAGDWEHTDEEIEAWTKEFGKHWLEHNEVIDKEE